MLGFQKNLSSLDIDGVMVPAAGWKTPENLADGFPMFSKKAVHALKSLLDGDIEIVLTTSHRARFTLLEWKMIFERRGLAIQKISCLDVNANLSSKDIVSIVAWFGAIRAGCLDSSKIELHSSLTRPS